MVGDPGHGRQGRRAPAHGGGRRARGAGQRGRGRDVEAAREAADRVGYPVFLKAAAGAVASAWRVWPTKSALAAAFATAQRRSQAAFGTARALRRALSRSPAPHRGAGDGRRRGGVVHLHERECSIQRRHQKLIEETPAPGLSADAQARLTEAALSGARAVGYANAGTMEFIVQGRGVLLPRDEHPPAGRAPGHRGSDGRRSRPGAAPGGLGRSPAVDAGRDRRSGAPASSAASTRRIPPRTSCHRPGGSRGSCCPRARASALECGVAEGVEVSVHYDPLLAKLIATGATRDEAIARLEARARPLRRRGREDGDPVPPAGPRERRLQGGRGSHADGGSGRLPLGSSEGASTAPSEPPPESDCAAEAALNEGADALAQSDETRNRERCRWKSRGRWPLRVLQYRSVWSAAVISTRSVQCLRREGPHHGRGLSDHQQAGRRGGGRETRSSCSSP